MTKSVGQEPGGRAVADRCDSRGRGRSRFVGREWGLGLVVVLLTLSSSGCVERYLRIRTVPEGATAYVNGVHAGTTPIDYEFDHYGHFRVDLWMDEYQSSTQIVDVEAPWYQFPFLDLFAELLDPRTHLDEHELTVEMAARRGGEVGPEDDVESVEDRGTRLSAGLAERAEALRARER